MAKKTKEERQAGRVEKRTSKEKEKKTQELNTAKIKLADQGAKEFSKKKRKTRKDPVDNGAVVTKNYPTLAEYVKANPETEETPTISGKDPKVEIQKNIIEKTDNLDEALSAGALGDAVKSQVDDVVTQVDDNASALKESIENTVVGDPVEGNRNDQAGFESYPGSGSALKGYAQDGNGEYDMTDEQFEAAKEDFRRQNAETKANAPELAIEKMGIEQYYPPQKDYVTSSFNGRYIGSRQIVAATGGLFPEGLTDARKRAKRDKAKAKADVEGKYWDLFSTSPQYDEDYKDIQMDFLNKYYEASGGDINALLTGDSKLSREFKRGMYDLEARGKNIIDVNALSESLIAGHKDGTTYLPPQTLKNLYKIRSATKDLTSYMEGEGMGDEDMKRITNSLRSFQNFTPLADDKLELLQKFGGNERLLAADADLDSPTFAADLESAVNRTKNIDYEEMRTVMSEFYNMDEVEDVVRSIYDNNDLWEGDGKAGAEQEIQEGVSYFMAMLPDKVDVETHIQNNKSLGWATLTHKKGVWDTKKAWRDQDLESMYDGLNQEMSDTAFQDEMIAAQAATTDPVERAKLIAKVLQKHKRTVSEVGGYVSASLPTTGMTTESVVQPTVIGSDGLERSIEAELAIRAADVERMKLAHQIYGTEYQTALDNVATLTYVREQGAAPITMNVGSRSVTLGVYDETTYNTVPLESYNGTIDRNNLSNIVNLGGQIAIPTGTTNSSTGAEVTRLSGYQFVDNHNIGNEASRRALSSQEGRAEAVGYSTEYKTNGNVSGTSNSSGSSSSSP